MSVKAILAIGTYDGGVASYELELDISPTSHLSSKLQMIFASPIHQGSVRSLMVAATTTNRNNCTSHSANHSNTTKKSKAFKKNDSDREETNDDEWDNDDDNNEGAESTSPSVAHQRPSTSPSSSSFILVSCGYDEMIKIHDYRKHTTSSGEIRLPTQYGTPNCSSFAPPYTNTANTAANESSLSSSHCLIGFIGGIDSTSEITAGKAANAATTGSNGGGGGSLVIYKKRDWSVQHVLRGHENGGVSCIAVHPSGKLALSGGVNDGKLKVWDLQRGRLAYTNNIQPKKLQTKPSSSTSTSCKKEFDAVVCIVWSNDGECYGYCYGNHVTVQHVATGRDLLDVELPSKVNQICLIYGTEGAFVAAACNDGSLPVLAIESVESSLQHDQIRRAIMAIEPVDGPVAGEDRFKCIQTICGYFVATANSAGVVSVMNLQGAINMITSPSTTEGDDDIRIDEDDSDDDGNDDDESEQELAVDIIDSVQIGNGARITCLVAWTTPLPVVASGLNSEIGIQDGDKLVAAKDDSLPHDSKSNNTNINKKRSLIKPNHDNRHSNLVELDPETLTKARTLVSQAKKIQHKKNVKRMKSMKNTAT